MMNHAASHPLASDTAPVAAPVNTVDSIYCETEATLESNSAFTVHCIGTGYRNSQPGKGNKHRVRVPAGHVSIEKYAEPVYVSA